MTSRNAASSSPLLHEALGLGESSSSSGQPLWQQRPRACVRTRRAYFGLLLAELEKGVHVLINAFCKIYL